MIKIWLSTCQQTIGVEEIYTHSPISSSQPPVWLIKTFKPSPSINHISPSIVPSTILQWPRTMWVLNQWELVSEWDQYCVTAELYRGNHRLQVKPLSSVTEKLPYDLSAALGKAPLRPNYENRYRYHFSLVARSLTGERQPRARCVQPQVSVACTTEFYPRDEIHQVWREL